MSRERVWVGAEERMKPRVLTLRNELCVVKVETVGGWVRSCNVGGVEVVVPYRGDNKKRSGIPRLGPVAGPVKGTEWEGLYPNMPQHGTERQGAMALVWVEREKVRMERVEGPREFKGVWAVGLEVEALERGVGIVEEVTNLTEGVAERAVALHPYIPNTSGGGEVVVPTSLMEQPELKEAKVVGGERQIVYRRGGDLEGYIRMTFEPAPWHLLRWRDSDDHEALEPWWAEMGKGEKWGPGERKRFEARIEYVG